MDELLVSWLSSDDVYEKVLSLIESNRSSSYNVKSKVGSNSKDVGLQKIKSGDETEEENSKVQEESDNKTSNSSLIVHIPSFYTPNQRVSKPPNDDEDWSFIKNKVEKIFSESTSSNNLDGITSPVSAENMFLDENVREPSSPSLSMKEFATVSKEICNFPSFFNGPLYRKILKAHNKSRSKEAESVTLDMFQHFWKENIENCDAAERFFRLLKQDNREYLTRDDFLPYIEELLEYHPGLEFLLNHAEFQEKYAVTVITRIFYSVNSSHNGKITARQIRKSDLIEAFHAVDEEEDINKVTRYFSYEHFYVLYCRFWELDHDRDYRITREDLLKYGDHSLSHLIVDRIFDAAWRLSDNSSRDYLSYEDFIFFMLSEEDKANEISVRYWFNCIDVDGDEKLNNMEMRSFYAVQLHRMQCLGHEIVPFEDMLCQMMDMIKPANPSYLAVEDFLQPECAQVSGALFDALFNLTKHLQFEQRDPFMERQKREDDFECDWDRFAMYDYNRLAMEEEQREEEAMEIDWVTVDDDDDEVDDFNSLGLGGASEAPF